MERVGHLQDLLTKLIHVDELVGAEERLAEIGDRLNTRLAPRQGLVARGPRLELALKEAYRRRHLRSGRRARQGEPESPVDALLRSLSALGRQTLGEVHCPVAQESIVEERQRLGSDRGRAAAS